MQSVLTDPQVEPPKLPPPRVRDCQPKPKTPEKKKKQSTLKEWCMAPVPRSAPRNDNSTRVQHPSSDEYPLHQDEMQAMDIDKSGVVYGIVQDGGYEPVHVGFKTAPTTPSDEAPLPRKAGQTISDDFVFEKPEIIPIKPPTCSPTKKRVYEEAVEPSMRRKKSREESMSSSSRSHVANNAQPNEAHVVKNAPGYSHPVRQASGRTSSTVSSGLERSFGSNSSLRSFVTGPSTGLTTPNTSFGPASTATSFDAYDQSEPTIVITEKTRLQANASYQKLPGLAHDPTLEVPIDEPLQRKDGIDFDPMELDDRAEKLMQERRPEKSFSDVEEPMLDAPKPAIETYLRTHLFEQSPFS